MSSDEETVRRPGRGVSANGLQNPANNDFHSESDTGDQVSLGADGEQMDEDDDADLFGSDGEEGGLENLKYAGISVLQSAQILRKLLATILGPWTIKNWTRATIKTDMTAAKTAWTRRPTRNMLQKNLISWMWT